MPSSHWPGKQQGHVDRLLQLPQPPLVAMVADKEKGQYELVDLARATIDNSGTKNTVVEERGYNTQDRLLLGPTEALEVLHHSTTGHLGIEKLLAKF